MASAWGCLILDMREHALLEPKGRRKEMTEDGELQDSIRGIIRVGQGRVG